MDNYVTAYTIKPIHYISGGQFITTKPWKHIERKINSFEIIIGIEETLYIDQQGEEYQVQPGDILLLLPNTVHKGYKWCDAGTSFYWFHFHLSDVKISSKKSISKEVLKLRAKSLSSHNRSTIFIPFYTKPPKIERINILTNQLLDVANSDFFNQTAVDYLMTTLLIEISEQTIEDFHESSNIYQADQRVAMLMEWIRLHAYEDITIQKVASQFNYNPDYLSRIFKQTTKMNISEYIHRIKIAKAKDLLTGTEGSIKEISNEVGIKDEKYFMRLFKKYEKVTPTNYRKAYFRTFLNNQ